VVSAIGGTQEVIVPDPQAILGTFEKGQENGSGLHLLASPSVWIRRCLVPSRPGGYWEE
jgi:hypothetical protein